MLIQHRVKHSLFAFIQPIRCILLIGIQRDIKQNCLPYQDWRPSIRAAMVVIRYDRKVSTKSLRNEERRKLATVVLVRH